MDGLRRWTACDSAATLGLIVQHLLDPLPLALVCRRVATQQQLQAAEAAIRVAQFNALAQRGLFFPQVGVNYTGNDQQLATTPTQDVPAGSVGTAWVRALMLDPAYQLK